MSNKEPLLATSVDKGVLLEFRNLSANRLLPGTTELVLIPILDCCDSTGNKAGLGSLGMLARGGGTFERLGLMLGFPDKLGGKLRFFAKAIPPEGTNPVGFWLRFG